jgi:type I restriction enzyme S subunit
MNEWFECRIDDLGTINRGKSKHSPRNDAILFGGDYPFIQTADEKKANLYITEYSNTYSDIGVAQSKLWSKGSLCITIVANIAESTILGIDTCFPDSVTGFIPFENKADLKFIKYLLDYFKIYIQQISKGTTQDNLSLEKLRRVKFRAPDYDTQIKIASILSAYDESIENNNKSINMLEKIVESLYNDWFSYEKTKKMSKEVRLKKIIEIARGVSYSSEEIDVENGINLVNLKRHYLL